MVAFLVLTAVTFSLFGFVIGIWAKGFEQLQFIPMLIVTPLTFLGGAFYSIDMLPPTWRTVALFNPVVYLISGFRWSFYGTADVARRHQPGDDARVPAACCCWSWAGCSRPATGSGSSRRQPSRRPGTSPSVSATPTASAFELTSSFR